MELIATMIGKNEGGRYLGEVLKHLSGIVDRIIFTDDGSDDNTCKVAVEAGASVIRLSDSIFEEDESSLRQIAWEHLCIYAKPGDWVLSIDADEKLYGAENLKQILSQITESVVMVRFFHMWNEQQYRVDKAWKPDHQPRLFKFHKEGNMMRRALACGQYPTYVTQMVRDGKVTDLGLEMQHLGYVKDSDKIAKFEKYMRLDGGKYHSLRHLESIVDEDPTLKTWYPRGNYGAY